MEISKKKALLKSISWRIIASICTLLIVWSITGKLKLSFEISAIEVVIKFIVFYWHERFWNKIKI